MINRPINEKMKLYAVTDRSWLKNGESLFDQVERALKGGATFIQLREKNMSHEDFLAEALSIKRLTDSYGVPFVINDDVEIAALCDADGVHVGQDDMTVAEVRSRLGDGKLIGVSAHSVEEALEAERAGADYIGVGAVFGTSTKNDAKPLSFEVLKNICDSVSIPVVAIGGITKDNIHKLKGSGVDGVAVVSAIFAADDIETETHRLAEEVSKMLDKGNDDKLIEVNSVISSKKGIIFDMDGTLLDSMPMWKELDYLFMKGFNIEPDDEYSRTVTTLTLPAACEYICARYGDKISLTPKQVENKIYQLIDEQYRDKLSLKPKALDYLKQLKKRGIKMVVATANEYDISECALRRTGVMDYIEGIITCTMAGAGKEQPEIYHKACEMLGLTTDECVVFEDTLHSVKTAKKAGFTVVGVYDHESGKDWSEICELCDADISFY